MLRGKPLSDEEKTSINAYKELKLSNRQIVKKLGRSSCVIDNFVKLGTQYGQSGRYFEQGSSPRALNDLSCGQQR
ncbi:hypothetical protein ANN_17890 [Periplaneta americana]|uniref:Tc3 transposase DNA binding domain-containing protein n=1 Tax=Periplaneta americana TaxID=6978 RepID=A0ABQ8SU78_PERAM|nr:hypothetical protein ANN_17890 [Periplaneta americana]